MEQVKMLLSLLPWRPGEARQRGLYKKGQDSGVMVQVISHVPFTEQPRQSLFIDIFIVNTKTEDERQS